MTWTDDDTVELHSLYVGVRDGHCMLDDIYVSFQKMEQLLAQLEDHLHQTSRTVALYIALQLLYT